MDVSEIRVQSDVSYFNLLGWDLGDLELFTEVGIH